VKHNLRKVRHKVCSQRVVAASAATRGQLLLIPLQNAAFERDSAALFHRARRRISSDLLDALTRNGPYISIERVPHRLYGILAL
jgi:hypothetical protein